MMSVDSFAGRTRAKSAAVTEASPGTAVFASPVSAAAAMRVIQVRVLSVDRSMGSSCVVGQDTTQRKSAITSHRDRLECDVLAAREIDRGVEANESLPPLVSRAGS